MQPLQTTSQLNAMSRHRLPSPVPARHIPRRSMRSEWGHDRLANGCEKQNCLHFTLLFSSCIVWCGQSRRAATHHPRGQASDVGLACHYELDGAIWSDHVMRHSGRLDRGLFPMLQQTTGRAVRLATAWLAGFAYWWKKAASVVASLEAQATGRMASLLNCISNTSHHHHGDPPFPPASTSFLFKADFNVISSVTHLYKVTTAFYMWLDLSGVKTKTAVCTKPL